MKHENHSSTERQLNNAALALDKQMLELKEERMKRFEQILSDVNWLKKEYEPRMENICKDRSKVFSELYQLRETLSRKRAKRREKHDRKS